MIITIDGATAIPKTAIGIQLATKMQGRFIHLGGIFRAIAFCKMNNLASVESMANLLSISPLPSNHFIDVVYLKGEYIDSQIENSPELESLCTKMAQDPAVRELVKELVNQHASQNPETPFFVEGRSGYYFFPEAVCKIFLAGSKMQTARNSDSDLKRLQTLRNESDYGRIFEPLRVHEDMIVWDCSYLSEQETVTGLKRLINHHLKIKPLTISIVIPAYNAAEHLVHTLPLLQQQHFPLDQYEIIVVDDGSTDNTSQVAKDHGCIVIKTNNYGPGSARNRAIEKATGDIIVFIDADILVGPDFLSLQCALHALSNNSLILGPRRHLPQGILKADPIVARLDSREKMLQTFSYHMGNLRHPWSLAYTCNLSLSKQLLGDTRFDENFTGWGLEDIDFAYQLYLKGARFAFVKRLASYHLFHDRSLSPARFEKWKQNLNHFIAKTNNPDTASFSLFAPVFDPAVGKNYFDVFDTFDPSRIPQKNLMMIDVSKTHDDSLFFLQNYLFDKKNQSDTDLLVIGDEEIPYEIFLYFVPSHNRMLFLPKLEWEAIREKIIAEYSQKGLTISEYSENRIHSFSI